MGKSRVFFAERCISILRGKEFPQAKAHLDTILTPETSTGVQSRIIHETMNDPEHATAYCTW
jgi:hypothetical protein